VHQDGTLEETLEVAERRLDDAVKAAAAAIRELRKARAAARFGQLRDLRRLLSSARTAASELAEASSRAADGFGFDEQAYLASGAYAKEVLATAAAAGVAMYEEDERLLCYPSLVRVLPGDAAVEVDRVRERRLRPSVLVAALAAAQQRAPRFRPGPFLDSLHGAYQLVVAREGKTPGTVVRLVDVWSVLTLLPGQSRDYTRQEFARDLYLLDQSGEVETRHGARLRWAASTGTRNAGVLTTVARSGQQQRYWGIAFAPAAGAGP
jgi:hypothetical protein